MAGYIGTGAVPQATQKRDSFTATAGQTSFPTSGYTPGFVDVYMNGVKLAPADFTATNSSDVVLAVAAVANDTLEIISFSTFEISSRTFTGDVTASGGTFLPTGDTSAGDAAAMGYAAADGLVLTGQGSTSDVTIKNDADATVMSIPTGTTGVTFAGTPTFPDGSINIADLDIDGGTDIGAALVDADLMVVDDGAGGTNRKATMSRLATYMGTKISGTYNLLQTVTADNSGGSITIGSSSLFSSTYTSYEIIVTDLVLANDTSVVYYLSLNGTLKGKTENAADYFYNGIAVQIASRNATTAATSRAASNSLYLMQSGSNETGGVSNFRVNISRPSETNTYKIVTHKGAFQANISVTSGIGNVRIIDDAGVWVGSDATTALTAITYETGSGNFVRGTFKLYGIS